MSVFITTQTIMIPYADLLCAMLLLAILCLKIVTLKQDSAPLMRLNKSLSLGLYPMSIIFGLLILEWTLL
ncbi:MAG: hypothetical protein AAF846_03585 [Chloroflexota bacterium]